MKMVMTGSTSFVGRYLVPRIEQQGWDICHLVRKESGFKHEIICDLKDPIREELPDCDAVIHLAAHVDFGKEKICLEQYATNTLSTLQLVDHAKSRDAFFVYTSMAGIHGFDKTFISMDSPIEPDTHYAVSKYLAEECIRRKIRNYSILRIGGVYGIDGPDHLALNRSLREAVIDGHPPTLAGPGQARRNYISVPDVAKWIAHLTSEYKEGNRNEREEVLYISGQEELSIETYLQTIVDICMPELSMRRTAGHESQDQIVESSPCPFERILFSTYVRRIQNNPVAMQYER